jgi:phospholipase C
MGAIRVKARASLVALPLVLALAAPAPLARAESDAPAARPLVTAQPAAVKPLPEHTGAATPAPELSQADLARLLQAQVKYVFVIFNENHSFDNEFGTFPGVNGLYSDGTSPRSAANTPGFTQTYSDVNGATVTVKPFLIGPTQNSSVVDSVDHSHTGLATKIHVTTSGPQMDQFAYDEYNRFASKGGTANAAEGTQFARLVMSHIDCDTIPFFWNWASNFTIFDNIFATEDTPSTPNAIAMIAGQAGETQWVKHGAAGQTYTAVDGTTGTTQGPPLVNDPQPLYGSQFDKSKLSHMPAGPKESYANTNIASNMTFATVPLLCLGSNVTSIMNQNLNPGFDTPDIQQDIPYLQSLNITPIGWRWYQEGFDLESTDTNGTASHVSYVSHHQGPQYFGYLAHTPSLLQNFRGMTDFFTDMAANNLPNGGVFYIRGGYTNQMGLTPAITNPLTPAAEVTAINAAKSGDDDHPSYTDRQLSEAMAARVINAVASNPQIWSQSAIIVTYDESDGFYDHVPPRILSYGPDGLPLSRGVRVPLILISPFARSHAVSHAEGDHNAVIQTIETIFGLPALASLPDEAQALAAGNSPAFNQFGPPGFQQQYLGPRDINSPITDSLLSGFDPAKLLGLTPPLPATLAMIPGDVVTTLPHYGGHGCEAIGIVPEDIRQRIFPAVPAGFNPLPSTYPAAN